jgi:hypothetical protein
VSIEILEDLNIGNGISPLKNLTPKIMEESTFLVNSIGENKSKVK